MDWENFTVQKLNNNTLAFHTLQYLIQLLDFFSPKSRFNSFLQKGIW